MGWFTPAGNLGIELQSMAVYAGGQIQGTVFATIYKEIEATAVQVRRGAFHSECLLRHTYPP